MSRALQRDRRFNHERARNYLAEILLAIEALHKNDIIYRDLKPDNIVFDEDGHALLTDFGLAKENILKEGAKSFCGSPAYLAPEMLRRKGHGKPLDWYLLGVLLYEMLVGIPPYYNNNKNKLFENISAGPLKMPRFIDENARNLIIGLLNRNASRRLGSGPTGAEEIKEHPFFEGINWKDAYKRRLYVPKPLIKRANPDRPPVPIS